MQLHLMQPVFRAEVSPEFAEISIRQLFLLRYSLLDLDYSQLRHRL